MAKRTQQYELYNTMLRLTRKHKPDVILHELSVLYEEYSIASKTEAEAEFWLKCSKATANLSSGTDKWFDEAQEDIEEEE